MQADPKMWRSVMNNRAQKKIATIEKITKCTGINPLDELCLAWYKYMLKEVCVSKGMEMALSTDQNGGFKVLQGEDDTQDFVWRGCEEEWGC